MKQKAKQKVDQQSDRTAQAVVDGAEGTVRCAAGDSKCIENAEKAGKVAVSASGDTLSASGEASTAADRLPSVPNAHYVLGLARRSLDELDESAGAPPISSTESTSTLRASIPSW